MLVPFDLSDRLASATFLNEYAAKKTVCALNKKRKPRRSHDGALLVVIPDNVSLKLLGPKFPPPLCETDQVQTSNTPLCPSVPSTSRTISPSWCGGSGRCPGGLAR